MERYEGGGSGWEERADTSMLNCCGPQSETGSLAWPPREPRAPTLGATIIYVASYENGRGGT